MKFSIKGLVTFTEEILNENFIFCAVILLGSMVYPASLVLIRPRFLELGFRQIKRKYMQYNTIQYNYMDDSSRPAHKLNLSFSQTAPLNGLSHWPGKPVQFN